jgi:hypothetical protein
LLSEGKAVMEDSNRPRQTGSCARGLKVNGWWIFRGRCGRRRGGRLLR